jgi:hypothetical protein
VTLTCWEGPAHALHATQFCHYGCMPIQSTACALHCSKTFPRQNPAQPNDTSAQDNPHPLEAGGITQQQLLGAQLIALHAHDPAQDYTATPAAQQQPLHVAGQAAHSSWLQLPPPPLQRLHSLVHCCNRALDPAGRAQTSRVVGICGATHTPSKQVHCGSARLLPNSVAPLTTEQH